MLSKPTLPYTWFVQEGTNRTTTKVWVLNEGGFKLDMVGDIALSTLDTTYPTRSESQAIC